MWFTGGGRVFDDGSESFGFFTWVIDTEFDPTISLTFVFADRAGIGDPVRFRFTRLFGAIESEITGNGY